MSFWAGVVQGVKDIDVLKEKEALADERQGVRDEATARYDESIAYRDRMQQITDDRNALIEGRAVEAHGVAMATAQFNIGQKIAGLAGGTGVGTRTGTGGGTVPTPQAMETGARALRARIDDIGGLDEMTDTQQTYYKSILGNVAASYELNNMLEAAVGEDKDLTVLTAVDRVRMVAVVAAQGQEAFAEFNRTAAEDGWDAAEVAEAIELAKSVNPAIAELVLLTPSKDNLTEQEQFSTFEAGLQFRAAAWAKANGEPQEFTTAMSQLQGTNLQEKNEGVATLIGMGVGQDWIHANTKPGSPLYDLAPPPVSAVPTVNADGALVPVGGGTAPADIPSFDSEADILKLPIGEQAALVGQRVNIDGVTGVMEGVPASGSAGKLLGGPFAITPSETPTTNEPSGGPFTLDRESLEFTGGRDRAAQGAPRTAAGGLAVAGGPLSSLGKKESAERLTELVATKADQSDIDDLILYMQSTFGEEETRIAFDYANSVAPDAPQEGFRPLPEREDLNPPVDVEQDELQQTTRSEGYRPTQIGATELNLPKVLEGLTPETRKIVEAELQSSAAGQGTTTLDRQSSRLSEDLNDVARSTGAGENLSTDRSAGPQMALQDLNQDDLVELEAGVEEVIKAIVDGADQGNIEVLVRELNAKFTPEIVGVAIQMAMGSNQ